ncbi:MAG TPA: DUF4012 domain-containing protein [Ktedonobacteraceae bacterium]|nr:DUF4012 domain-containing protein [Ktedonobacteraceae bacterium]
MPELPNRNMSQPPFRPTSTNTLYTGQPPYPPAILGAPGMPSPYIPNPGINAQRASSQTKRRRSHSFARLLNKYKGFSTPVKVLSLILLFTILASSMTGVFTLINGIILYTQITGAVNHLKAAENIFQGGTKSDNSKYFDVSNLQKAQIEITAAHGSFAALSDELDHDGSLSIAGSILPSQMTSLRKIGHIAVDGTAAAQQAVQTAIEIAPVVGPGLKAQKDPSKPYIDQASFDKVMALLSSIKPLVHDMSQNAQGISLAGLPISASQSKMITDILPLLPAVDNVLSQAPQYKDAIAWLLGIGGSRTILLEPMDTAELRSTGGFTGQFGELTFTGGHMAPLSMKNLGAYEEDHSGLPGGVGPINPDLYNNRVVGQAAPGLYGDWWPFANFGMRDANVSADFPTSAQIILNRYEFEFQKNADGVIAFTPQLIQQVLQVTGPIKIPLYNETITAQNLEAKLHYYQLDNAGIRKEKIIEHQPDPELARKLFTQRVTQQLMLTGMHLPVSKLLPLANQMLQATKTKDLQIYFDNKQLEGLIGKYGSEVTMDRSNAYDGVFVVQSNDSGSKASQYVTTAIQDTVTVDAQGNATHNMLMTLNYQQKGSVFGQDTYRDYVRVYVPQNSTLVSGNGFAQAQTFCTDFNCQSDVYGDGTLVCTPPVVVGDSVTYNSNLAYPGGHLNTTGEPTNTNSDESGKGMFAGWVMIPKNCVMKVSLSWTVPPLGTNGYQMLLQAQGGIDTNVNLSISDAACPSSSNLHYASTIHGQNTMFSVQKSGSSCTLQNKPKW